MWEPAPQISAVPWQTTFGRVILHLLLIIFPSNFMEISPPIFRGFSITWILLFPSCLLLSGLITSDFLAKVSPLRRWLFWHHGISSFVGTQNYVLYRQYHKKPKKKKYIYTPPKINIEPENDGLEDDFPFKGSILRFHVNLLGRI